MVEIAEIEINQIEPSPYQHRKYFDKAKLQELAKSIKRDGLIEPIVVRSVNGRYELIAGERRVKACELVELSDILSRIVDVPDLQARRMCAAENLQREDLSAIEQVGAIIEMVDAELIENKEYQKFGEEPIGRVKYLLMKLRSDHRNNTNHFTSKFTGKIDTIFLNLPKPIEWISFYDNDLPLITKLDQDVSEFAIENKLNKSQAKKTQTLKEKAPEVFEKIKQEPQVMIFNENLEMEKVEFTDLSTREIGRLAKKPSGISPNIITPKPPEGIFNVLYADPPWQYDNAISNWGPARLHYTDMDLEKICTFVEDIDLQISTNAVLFLWVTNPFLQAAFRVIEKWRFEYKTNMVWIKTELKRPGSGFYVRGRHELLWICTKGSFTPLDKHISPPVGSVVEAPVGKHSQKPDRFYEIIETLYPKCNYIELFARQQRKGWKTYGNQAIEFLGSS